VDRLTDNISNLRTYFLKEMGVGPADFDVQFGITDEIWEELL
jgi:hypothetical protein